MKLTTRHYVGIGLGLSVIIGDFLFFPGTKIFPFLLGVAVLIAVLPFLAAVMIETGREKEKESMFLEFSRSLVESVRAGTPISKSIINIRGKDFGSLTSYVNKLANQIALGIPVKQAFAIFARDLNNKVISRSVALITEADASGGQIDEILESVSKSVSEVEDVKKERKSSMYNLVIELYIIFFIFVIIMIIMQVKFIPMMLSTLSESGGLGAGGPVAGINVGGFGAGAEDPSAMLNQIFPFMMVIQGFFAGLVIGKLSEGVLKAGFKHSVIIIAISYLATTGVKALVA